MGSSQTTAPRQELTSTYSKRLDGGGDRQTILLEPFQMEFDRLTNQAIDLFQKRRPDFWRRLTTKLGGPDRRRRANRTSASLIEKRLGPLTKYKMQAYLRREILREAGPKRIVLNQAAS